MTKATGCILLIILKLSFSFAQHVLVTPQNYHIGVQELISFTSYDEKELNVSATLSYGQCTCKRRRRYKGCSEESEVVYSTDMATANQGQNIIFRLKMPDFADVHFKSYFLSVVSSDGQKYLKKHSIHFQLGHLLIKTDKPIYKPSQVVRFCVVHVDKNMKPFRSSVEIKVTVRDSKRRQIVKWNKISTSNRAFVCREFALSDEPAYGRWRIKAKLVKSFNRGHCRKYYSVPKGSCHLEVNEFVLPKFYTIVDGPDHIMPKDDSFKVVVVGKYVFGQRLVGSVKVNATLVFPVFPWKRKILIYNQTDSLVYGTHTSSILVEDFLNKTHYPSNPFCIKGTKIRIMIEATEKGRGLKVTKKLQVPLKSDSVSFEFADDVSKFFRPGLPYTVKAIAKSAKGLASSGAKARVVATINNGNETLLDSVLSTVPENSDHVVVSTFHVPAHTNCLKITVYPVDVHYSCKTDSSVCMAPAPFYSPTRSFLQLTSSSSTFKVGSQAILNVTSTVPFTLIHYIVISRGGVVLHTKQDTVNSLDEGVKQSGFVLPISSSMVPDIKVLAAFAREDGELVMDLLELKVQCELDHKVSLSFNASTAEPGDGVSIATESNPDSLVLLSVSDSSLRLLAEACKSMSEDSVCKLLGSSGNHGNLNVDTSCSDSSLFCPSACSEPTKYSIKTLIQATGVKIMSDMFIPSPPPISPCYWPYYEYLRFYDQPLMFYPEPVDTGSSDEEKGKTREFFPESWVWTILETDSRTGRTSLDTIVPDTITTWTAEAVAISSDKGLGISPEASLTVKKTLFVSLELPYSLNWGEILKITPLVFNLQRSDSNASISVTVNVDEELSILEPEPPSSLSVPPRQSGVFDFFVKARSVGHFDVTVTIRDINTGLVDRVKKVLFVKPGCKKYSVSNTTFVKGSGQQCYSYTLPSCVVPRSASAVITTTGDIMSFPNLDHLLVLPSGCGEQNLVKTAINLVVAKYLASIEALQDHVTTKIKNNLQIGYQKQLNYQATRGCFSIWSGHKCTSWLTAAVVRYFSVMHEFYNDQDYQDQVVDKSVVSAAVTYLLAKQVRTGKFPLIGWAHNRYLLSDKAQFANTAFTLVALKRYKTAYKIETNTKLNNAISQAESHLVPKFGNNLCTYGLAIAVYSLHLSPSYPSSKMKNILKSRIQTSAKFPGTCFACDMSSTTCGTYYARSERSSVCVETTAYALLAMLHSGDMDKTLCLAQWLVRIRNGAGGYYSSQDTIVALEALSKFAEATFSKELNLQLQVSLSSGTTSSHTITDSNRHEVHEVEVDSIPSDSNCVSWSGNGTGIVQSTLTYHGCGCDNDSASFSLELATELVSEGRLNKLNLQLRLKYLEKGESNMVIVDVELPSGYSFESWKNTNKQGSRVERREIKGSSIVFYFNELTKDSNTSLLIVMEQNALVTNPQSSPVSVYDYYDPGKTVTQYYKPETSKALITLDELTEPTYLEGTPPLPIRKPPPLPSIPNRILHPLQEEP